MSVLSPLSHRKPPCPVCPWQTGDDKRNQRIPPPPLQMLPQPPASSRRMFLPAHRHNSTVPPLLAKPLCLRTPLRPCTEEEIKQTSSCTHTLTHLSLCITLFWWKGILEEWGRGRHAPDYDHPSKEGKRPRGGACIILLLHLHARGGLVVAPEHKGRYIITTRSSCLSPFNTRSWLLRETKLQQRPKKRIYTRSCVPSPRATLHGVMV